MDFKIVVDREIETPIYRQIIEQVTLMIKKGFLKPGSKLPPERELANSISMARGTVKKAYEELQRNKVVEVIQGRGTFVSKRQDVLAEGRKDRAIKLINNLLSELDQMNFSHREINTFIHILLMQRESSNKDVKVAAVDCNPEALEIFKKQLSYISHVKLFKFLLDDINNSNNAGKTFENYDLILTTSTHYSELHGILPALKEKIMQAAVSPGQQTVIDIATITNSADIGILCISKKFLNIIRNTLKSFQIDMKKVSYIFGNDRADIGPFIYSKNVLIIPPDGVIEKRYEDEIKSYRERGGIVIKFDYQIERGSLIYIEEQISKILERN